MSGASLARLAAYRGDAATASAWQAQAAAVASTFKAALWNETIGAQFARDAADEVIDVMVHDSLRSMWQGSFDQDMADAFVTRHLMNRSEFWTPTPLPSISVSDPRYNAIKNANTWSGRPMGVRLSPLSPPLSRSLAPFFFPSSQSWFDRMLVITVDLPTEHPCARAVRTSHRVRDDRRENERCDSGV